MSSTPTSPAATTTTNVFSPASLTANVRAKGKSESESKDEDEDDAISKLILLGRF